MFALWKTLVLPKVKYGLHPVHIAVELRRKWPELEKAVMVTGNACFSEKTRKRLTTIARITSIEHLKRYRCIHYNSAKQ